MTFGAIVWALLVAMSAAGGNSQQKPAGGPAVNGYVGNEACAPCHGSTSESFSRTAHAHASGPATENLVTGEFTHQKSQVKYRVYSESGRVWMSFERPGDPLVQGRRELLYYIGQGRRGTTYLFAVDKYFFEAPINLYTSRHVWDMAPAYGDAREIPMNLPALPSCMDCHVSGIRPPIDGTENRYAMPLFLHAGVTCERCHGPGESHVNAGKGAIVNPAKLAPERRDQICMQCHLEGNAAIERPGRHLYQYRPGDDLSDYVRYFVLTDTGKPGLRAASQFEELAQSNCKKKSGDAMSCTSCHDPHRTISPDDRITFYREKCLVCHSAQFGEKHHSSQPDCTQCHMPATASTDVAHTAVTDHSIPRRPTAGPKIENATYSSLPQLVAFPYSKKSDVRDLALAWQSIVNSGMTMAEPEADRLLRQAAAQFPDDPPLLAALGYAEQQKGASDKARELYRRALALDPTLFDVKTNLGVLEARSGQLPEAVRLWQDAFRRAPGRSNVGMNLAHAFCESGQFDDARNYVMRVLQFNPDFGSAKALLKRLNADPPTCAP